MDLYFLDHVCFFWALVRINNHIADKSIYFEKGPAVMLNSFSIYTFKWLTNDCFCCLVVTQAYQ